MAAIGGGVFAARRGTPYRVYTAILPLCQGDLPFYAVILVARAVCLRYIAGMETTKKGKRKTSVSLSEAATRLLAALSEKYGVSQSAILELAIREKAEQAGITPAE